MADMTREQAVARIERVASELTPLATKTSVQTRLERAGRLSAELREAIAALTAQTAGEAVAEKTLPVTIRGKTYDVPIAVQLRLVALEDAIDQANAKPFCYVRTLNGSADWSEDCVCEEPGVVLQYHDEADGYGEMPLFAHPAPQQPAENGEQPRDNGPCLQCGDAGIVDYDAEGYAVGMVPCPQCPPQQPADKPVWEREPPHCPTCDCGGEQPADKGGVVAECDHDFDWHSSANGQGYVCSNCDEYVKDCEPDSDWSRPVAGTATKPTDKGENEDTTHER